MDGQDTIKNIYKYPQSELEATPVQAIQNPSMQLDANRERALALAHSANLDPTMRLGIPDKPRPTEVTFSQFKMQAQDGMRRMAIERGRWNG